jgi:long-chain-fatty-acid--[acyl-carrier-protein] ligase
MDAMLNSLVAMLTRWLLALRYRVEISGLDRIAAAGRGGILFLPNHPALIDPVILSVHLYRNFRPRAVADVDQIDRFLIRRLARRMRVVPIPSFEKHGSAARKQIEASLDKCVEAIAAGENVLLWPAGRAYRSLFESLRGSSAVEHVLARLPETRIVTVRTRGLWGSGFSRAAGREPDVARTLLKGAAALLSSGIFFAPRRAVTIEFAEPADFPRKAGRNEINRFLENYYNAAAAPNTYVPYSILQGSSAVTRPEPEPPKTAATDYQAPEETRKLVIEHLGGTTGFPEPDERQTLAEDLGMDSLAQMDLVLWLEREFGFPVINGEMLHTVGDVLAAAGGELSPVKPVRIRAVPRRWSRRRRRMAVTIPAAETIPGAFLAHARRLASKPAVADGASGVKTHRDIVAACILLKDRIEQLEGERVAVMLPSSAAFTVLYLSIMFAGRIPVIINYTGGVRNVTESLRLSGAKRVMTSRVLAERLRSRGIDLSAMGESLVFIEDIRRDLSAIAKARAFLAGYLSWRKLENARIAETAAILFTSGSETLPKAVPLTHRNILANLRDVLGVVTVYEDDRLIGMLPPFHSLGLTGTVALVLCAGVSCAYCPDPTDAAAIAAAIGAYGTTTIIGTPAFLGAIVRAAGPGGLNPLRLVITGADACGKQLYRRLEAACPNAVVLEGYGTTECSPIVSINPQNDPRPMTIGRILPSYEYMLADPDTCEPAAVPGRGELLVRGPSVFAGYLNYGGESPFVSIGGRSWYRTGDVVSVDRDGVLTFRARLKRFVKLGGEMISLPAIEAVLESRFAAGEGRGPVLAVEATGDRPPQLVLFAACPVDRQAANEAVRAAGLSALHNIRKVVRLDEIPALATGKTDHRKLREQVAGSR